MATFRLRRRELVMATLFCIFLGSVALREPWRGHLAQGDQWVTALALRWVRAWHRDGAWASRFAWVESPPTAEFARRHVHKWGFPGQMLLIHAVAQLLDIEPDVELLKGFTCASPSCWRPWRTSSLG